jgi:hypothetical protein
MVIQSLRELLELHGLVMTKAPGPTLAFAVTREGGQATNADRELVIEWVARNDDQGAFNVSDVFDLSE